ncbi:MAG: dienelactone hydrolase family protein [Pseudomonadota bacterium]
MRSILSAIFLAIFTTNHTAAEQICGIGENECKTSLGNYNIELPNNASGDDKIPAMIYFHGAGGNGQRSLKNREMVEAFLTRGYAVIAPTGLKRPNSNWGPMWSFHPQRPKQRDELEFAKVVLDDASSKFNLDRDQILMTGFSIGGSLTWYLACEDPQVAKAFAPVAGAFWRPHDVGTACHGPVQMLHTHGWRDGTVPLEGRVLGGGRIEQGDVFYSLQILRSVNGCNNYKADKFDTSGKFWKRWWVNCKPGSALQLNLFDGGHGVPQGWAKDAIDWFEALDNPKQG